jgi:putative FmdB family regulatory protein
MPIYEYEVREKHAGCEQCTRGLEVIQRISDPVLAVCPHCGAPVVKRISAPSVGFSKSTLDSRAKSAGFTQFKKSSKGEYERKF